MFLAITLVIASGVIHSVWNMFAKKSDDKTVFLWYCQWAAIVLFLPLVLMEAVRLNPGAVPAEGWAYMLLSIALHGGYVFLLARTYTAGDLSQAYPIMRGTSPLLVPVIGVALLQERLAITGWIGVAAIVIGIFLTGRFRFGTRLQEHRVLPLAIGVGTMVAAYTVVDKVALRYFEPFPC